MFRKTFHFFGVGLLLGFGFALPVEADDIALERPGFALTTLDGSGNVGQYSSVAIGADGLALISYYDATNGDLKVAHCSNVTCTAATLSTVDSVGSVGQYSSVTIGADGLALISYYDSTDQVLKLALCPDLACTSATFTNTPDRTGNVGQYSSVTIGTDGLALISYYDATNGDLKVAHCFDSSDSICTTATRTTLQSEGNVGQFTALTIGTDGLALISYYDATNGDLKVAHCSDAACTSATLTALDGAANNVGAPSSMIIGTDGRSLISYFDKTNGDLKVAHCSDVACTSATRATVDGTADIVGAPSSMIMGADSRGFISYYDETNGDLKVAHCSNVGCTAATLSTVDSAGSVGQYSSVTIGADGRGLISYFNATTGDLKVAHCSNVVCTAATLSMVDSAGSVGQYSSVTIGADGLALISYYDETNGDLKVAHCSNVGCTAATLSTVDSAGSVGQYSSVTIGADGLALISYYDETNGDLKVAHCSNLFCVPYHRRR